MALIWQPSATTNSMEEVKQMTRLRELKDYPAFPVTLETLYQGSAKYRDVHEYRRLGGEPDREPGP